METTSQTSIDHSQRPLIAWLWFWLLVYIYFLPTLLPTLWEEHLKEIFFPSLSILNDFNPIYQFTPIANLMELTSFAAILIGVIAVFFPKARGKFIEKHYSLQPVQIDTATPSLIEIVDFIKSYAPEITITVNPNRFDQLAFIYPLGFRKNGIALFGGIVPLWRKNKTTAQAILLHEIGHCKQGDVLITGAGSLLEWLVNHWAWLFLFLLPIFIMEIYEIINTWKEFGNLRLDVWFNQSQAGELLSTNLRLFLLGDLSIFLMEVVHIAWVIILPVTGLWISEFGADRFVAKNLQDTESITKALSLLRGKKSILPGSHPPIRWRKWFVRHFAQPKTWILAAILLPLAYVIKAILYLFIAANASWMPDREAASIIELLKNVTYSSLETLLPLWFIMVVVILCWPALRVWGLRLLADEKQNIQWSGYRQNVIAACIVGILVVAGWFTSGWVAPTALPEESQAQITDKQEFALGEIIHAAGLDVTVYGWEEITTEEPGLTPEAGNKLIAVTLRATNTSSDVKHVAALTQMMLQDDQNHRYEHSVKALVITNQENPDGQFESGETKKGIVGFEIPENATGLQFIFIDGDHLEARVSLGEDPQLVDVTVPPSNSPQELPAIGEAVQVGDLILTVEGAQEIAGNEAFQPDPGFGYIAVNLSLENIGDQDIELMPFLSMKIKDETGAQYGDDMHATVLADSDIAVFKIKPKTVERGTIGFQAPANAQSLTFVLIYENENTFVQLPRIEWQHLPTTAQQGVKATSVPDSEADLLYDIPADWIEKRKAANLPEFTGNYADDFSQSLSECLAGIQIACEINDSFLDITIR